MFEIKLIKYGLLRCVLQFSQFVWPLNYSVWDVFNNFLLIDATDRSKISSNQKRFFIALSRYPLSFFANTPFKGECCLLKFITYATAFRVTAVCRSCFVLYLKILPTIASIYLHDLVHGSDGLSSCSSVGLFFVLKISKKTRTVSNKLYTA